MTQDRRQVLRLADILVGKHGRNAPAVAAHRVRLWADAHDPVTADLWRAVGEAIVHRLAQPQREPSLSEVLDGAVTRRTMNADGVSREDVEAIMSAARKRQRRKA
jgi:hypothetical protein